jgi:cobalamin biosynthesis Mg chelatase CobN
VDPFFKLYVEPGHLLQAPPTSEYVPIGHNSQLLLPASDAVPTGHRVHSLDPLKENVPAEQMIQLALELARCSGPYDPAGHSSHTVCPKESE